MDAPSASQLKHRLRALRDTSMSPDTGTRLHRAISWIAPNTFSAQEAGTGKTECSSRLEILEVMAALDEPYGRHNGLFKKFKGRVRTLLKSTSGPSLNATLRITPPTTERGPVIRCHLPNLIRQNKLRISDVARATGLNRSTISALCRQRVTRIELSALDKLCALFNCGVGELLEHVAEAERQHA